MLAAKCITPEKVFLFNKQKELIGINTFTTAKAENLNFAVSVDDLIEFINSADQEEIESGYMLHDRVLRPAKVIVTSE